jgi:CheY-like chemotaxis protein
VTVAAEGCRALSALDQARFDVVLMDVQLPEMDGFETTGAIRARERGTGVHLPIIAMTAHAMKGDRERCIAAGMDSYISKPFEIKELIELLERFSSVLRKKQVGSRSKDSGCMAVWSLESVRVRTAFRTARNTLFGANSGPKKAQGL